jgi:hypothetical protein
VSEASFIFVKKVNFILTVQFLPSLSGLDYETSQAVQVDLASLPDSQSTKKRSKTKSAATAKTRARKYLRGKRIDSTKKSTNIRSKSSASTKESSVPVADTGTAELRVSTSAAPLRLLTIHPDMSTNELSVSTADSSVSMADQK